MVVSKMFVWVKIHDLPLHFWHHKLLEGIGNSLGKFFKINVEKVSRGVFNFSRIYIEVDLSQGLPDNIILAHKNIQWTQPLDHESMTLCCHGCQQIGHLHNACSQANKDHKRNKKQSQKPKGWQRSEP